MAMCSFPISASPSAQAWVASHDDIVKTAAMFSGIVSFMDDSALTVTLPRDMEAALALTVDATRSWATERSPCTMPESMKTPEGGEEEEMRK